MTCKTFLRAVAYISVDHRKAAKFLMDKRLSLAEKKILEGWLALKHNQCDEIIASLSAFQAPAPLLESMRLLILGSAYNNRGDLGLAVPEILRSYELIKETEFVEQKFMVLRTLFQIHLNLKDGRAMKKYITLLAETERHPRFDDSFLLCQLGHALHSQKLAEAKASIEQIELRFAKLNDFNKVSFLLYKFDYAIKIDDFNLAEHCLDRLKAHRTYLNVANFKFMRSILDHLVNGTSLYVYDRDFHSGDVLYLQLNTLSHLEAGDREGAKHSWQKLMEMAPETYGEDFRFKGDKCLFSLALNKLRGNVQKLKQYVGLTKQKHLLALLRDAKLPLRKELLYELIWGEHIESKADLKKLSKMISVLQKTEGHEITYTKGCYQLISPKKKQKAS